MKNGTIKLNILRKLLYLNLRYKIIIGIRIKNIETETDTQTPSQRRDVLQCLYLSVSSIADQVRQFTDRRISRLKCDDTSLIPNFPQIHRHLSFKLISVARLMTSQTVWCRWPPLISSSSLFK